ncbi:MAG: adenylate/guanylate cyclase, partial [Spartobacteria bacterium]|nr:adenylate/guanylate cyclase [Spartobacteria bacterium]
MSDRDEHVNELRAAIAGLEAQRGLLGDAVVDPALAALRQQLRDLERSFSAAATEEERKLVTILFVDVSGFTALSETLDPEEVRGLMNACFERLVPVVQKYGGTIDKFIGDEIMALFGAPIAHENDPERALRAALELMDAILLFNREQKTDLGLHIGINTGRVVTGRIGSQDRRDYSVMGDAVNLAARLEDASADGEIFVGPSTHHRTAALFDFETLPPLQLKGKAKPVDIYRLLGLKAAPKPTRGIAGLRAGLVGRSHEVDQMRSALGGLREGKGGVVAVVGEAGLGKSRLVAEALGAYASNLPWAEGRALSHSTGMSYWMARDLLRSLVGISEDTPSAQSEFTLQNSLERVLSKSDAADIYAYLARLLELPLQDSMQERVKFLTSQALHGRI